MIHYSEFLEIFDFYDRQDYDDYENFDPKIFERYQNLRWVFDRRRLIIDDDCQDFASLRALQIIYLNIKEIM